MEKNQQEPKQCKYRQTPPKRRRNKHRKMMMMMTPWVTQNEAALYRKKQRKRARTGTNSETRKSPAIIRTREKTASRPPRRKAHGGRSGKREEAFARTGTEKELRAQLHEKPEKIKHPRSRVKRATNKRKTSE